MYAVHQGFHLHALEANLYAQRVPLDGGKGLFLALPGRMTRLPGKPPILRHKHGLAHSPTRSRNTIHAQALDNSSLRLFTTIMPKYAAPAITMVVAPAG
jgi:hypothetical protein